MADEEVERLVIAPFREIVDKATIAIGNAKDAEADDESATMLKAAQSLLKEGERAVKRIEPLCTKHCDEYGLNFVNAIKEHDGIAEFRSELMELLWDFDEYVEPNSFNMDKFEGIQKASRKAAPKILDYIRRMKLVPLVAPATTTWETRPSPSAAQPSSCEGSVAMADPSSENEMAMDEVKNQLMNMGTQAGPDQGLEGGPRVADVNRSDSSRSGVSEESSDSYLPWPAADKPWEIIGRTPTLGPRPQYDDSPAESRPPLLTGDSPTLPAASVSSREDDARQRYPYQPSQQGDLIQRQLHNLRNGTNLPTRSGSITSLPPAIPENRAINNQSHSNGSTGTASYLTRQASLNAQLLNQGNVHPALRQASQESINSSVFDVVQYDDCSSSAASLRRASSVASTLPTSPRSPEGYLPQYSPHPPIYKSRPTTADFSGCGDVVGSYSQATLTPLSPTQSQPQVQPGIEPVDQAEESGLIPVESEVPEEAQLPIREPDCSIGPHSSFYQMKGFCKGAEEAIRGELGFKKIKRPVGGFSMVIVAKCNHCLFELDYRSVEQDLKNDSQGNFTSNGIGFRLRILQKSHLPIKHVDEQMYGCVLCIQAGHTNEESDATVFFSQKQLFQHMARHPRPLPSVPGLTIVEGNEMSQNVRGDFDLFFPNPPTQSVMAGLAREISKLPSGVATEMRKNANGILRSPPDRGPVLQFAAGARIVGIEFPAHYEGKWGKGWHDGVRAAFEAESVRLDAPPRNEIRMHGTSPVQGVVRWKWNQGGEGNWLKLSKGETIKNMSWAYTDHWCWSGISSKGAWGIFPQSHIEPGSIKTVQPGDSVSLHSTAEKKGGAVSALSRFSIRKNADQPPSKAQLQRSLPTRGAM